MGAQVVLLGARSVPVNHQMRKWSDDCAGPDSHYVVWYDLMVMTSATCMN